MSNYACRCLEICEISQILNLFCKVVVVLNLTFTLAHQVIKENILHTNFMFSFPWYYKESPWFRGLDVLLAVYIKVTY
jgi:hypothetical protein